ncbi:alkaline phosphatase family protein [Sporosarcina quadrami]|uniref:alkaline phosphatase family protein n=1 Tax=Sporosarcina quadrami TaxID=2762234 RepID=UPI001CD8641B
MNRLTDHLIVISFDCLSSKDMPIVRELPNFKKLLDGAAVCENVKPIYPSVTYPCHTSIITGNYPNRHRIVRNTLIQPGKESPDWYWQRKYIQGTTLYDEAKKQNMKTGALLWPVTARAKIDYHIPEIFANRPWHSQVAVSLLNGSFFYTLEMNRRFGNMRKGIKQPWLDDFVTAVATHTIRTKKPDLMLIHLVDIDYQRHEHGFAGEESLSALRRQDKRLGKILQAIDESGNAEETTIIALGDHSALDVTHAINMNVYLQESGLIQTDRNGKVKNWKVYCKSNDGSAYLYVKDENDKPSTERLGALLHSLMQNPDNGLEKVVRGSEAAQMGADGEAAFMLEAREGFYFTEDMNVQPLVEIKPCDITSGKYCQAVHGYSPSKIDYRTVFIAKGKGIVPNVTIESMSLVDEGPTFARLLGLNLGETDGRILDEIILS